MANYVLTLALETELWQEHILEKRDSENHYQIEHLHY